MKVFTTSEVCQLLNVKPRALDYLFQKGVLKADVKESSGPGTRRMISSVMAIKASVCLLCDDAGLTEDLVDRIMSCLPLYVLNRAMGGRCFSFWISVYYLPGYMDALVDDAFEVRCSNGVDKDVFDALREYFSDEGLLCADKGGTVVTFPLKHDVNIASSVHIYNAFRFIDHAQQKLSIDIIKHAEYSIDNLRDSTQKVFENSMFKLAFEGHYLKAVGASVLVSDVLARRNGHQGPERPELKELLKKSLEVIESIFSEEAEGED